MSSSTPSDASNTSLPNNDPSLPNTSTATTSNTSSSISGGPPTGQLPSGLRLIERTMKDAAWPADLILDMTKSNWTEWEHMLSLAVRQCGIRPWLDGSIPCPDAGTSPDAYHIWRHNDDSLSAFITRYISKPDILHTKACKTAAEIFSRLRVLHENQGAYAQLTLLTKALLVHFKYDKPLSETAAEIVQFHN